VSSREDRTKEALRLLRELRNAPEHSFAASTYRSGQWRHMGCGRCVIEERVDQLLSRRRSQK
jgi:hypothetical protein